MSLCTLGMPREHALTTWRERVHRAGPPEPQDPNARRMQRGAITMAEALRLARESRTGSRTDPLIRRTPSGARWPSR